MSLYPDYDLAGTEWTVPEMNTHGYAHYWAGWTWRILRPSAACPDMWEFERRSPDGSRTVVGVDHGISLRGLLQLAHPVYDQEHIITLVLEHSRGLGFRHAAERASHVYAATGDYSVAIKALRGLIAHSPGGVLNGALEYNTLGGKLTIRRPLEVELSLEAVARRLFPKPGKLVQLQLF